MRKKFHFFSKITTCFNAEKNIMLVILQFGIKTTSSINYAHVSNSLTEMSYI